MSLRSSEHRVATETFLLPGQQQFCVKPWEIANLPRNQLARPAPAPAPGGNTLDDSTLGADPCEGWEIGACQIIRRLSPGSVKSLLAVRQDAREGSALVVLRRIEVPEAQAEEIETHAQWARRFRHPNLGRVFNTEVTDEGVFWVSERASGATLAELAAACKKMGKGLPLGLALAVTHEAALALGELHVPNGFSHGLISDQSVAIAFDGTARVQDLGLFRCMARQSSWGEVLDWVGPYLAPEQILGGHAPDPKCDVFSLGAVLYELLSGSKLARTSSFDDRVKKHLNANFLPPSSLNVALGQALDEVLARALSPDRASRYATSLDFARALKQAASAFMWRSELRSEFVGKLFETRKRREQVLLAGCTPRRSLTSPELAMPIVIAAPVPPPLPAAVVLAPAPMPAVLTPSKRARRRAKARGPSRLRPLSLTLLASALAWIAWGGVVPGDLEHAIASVGQAQGPVSQLAAPGSAAPSRPVPELMCLDAPAFQTPAGPPDRPGAGALAVDLAPSASPQKLPKKGLRPAKQKRAADDLPTAPWLQPHGRRNR